MEQVQHKQKVNRRHAYFEITNVNNIDNMNIGYFIITFALKFFRKLVEPQRMRAAWELHLV